MEYFKYFGRIATHKRSILEKLRTRWNQGILIFGAEYFVFEFTIKK